jgi:5'-nucleotidase (lipoprotein e(P4) family)
MPKGAAALAALLALSGCAASIAGRSAPAPVAAAAPGVPKTFQWMGSGEAAALSRQSYDGFTRYAIALQTARMKGAVTPGALLADGASLEAPVWSACGAKPPAVILDMDETTVLNTGANYDTARRGDPPFDPARWDAWEAGSVGLLDPVPGAVEAFVALRAAGITPIIISNRQARFASQAAQGLAGIGLGDFAPGKTMLLREAGSSSGKDMRRGMIGQNWCVIAMAGDQLGDFSDLFNAKGLTPDARRRAAQGQSVAARWGQGWFLMPNPLYGTGVAGTIEQIFPDHRWPGPEAAR